MQWVQWVQWVQESYTLVFAALLLMFGTIADRIGRRKLLIIGVIVFALSSVLAALAWSGDTRYSALAAAGFLTLGLLATIRLDSRLPEHEDAEPVADDAARGKVSS